jgi:hypothetical protein
MQRALKIFIFALNICIYATLHAAIYTSNQSAFPTWNEEIGYIFEVFLLVIIGGLLLIAKYFRSRKKHTDTAQLDRYGRHFMSGAILLLILAAFPTFKNIYLKHKYEITTKHIWGSGSVDFVDIYVKNKLLCTIIDRSSASFEDRNKDGFADLLIDEHVMLYEPVQKTFLNCPYLGG